MRRKLIVALMSATAISVIAAGIGVLILSEHITRMQAKTIMSKTASVISTTIARNENRLRTSVLNGTAIAGAHFILISPTSAVIGELPATLPRRYLDIAALESNLVVTGTTPVRIYLQQPVTLPAPVLGSSLAVVILTRTIPGSYVSTLYLVLVGGTVLILSYLLAIFLSGRMTGPLYSLVEATRRIANGDLSAPVVINKNTDAEMADLADAINHMATELRETREAERQFLLSISHDLRTPLTSIMGFSESIVDGAVADPQRAARTILKEAKRLEVLVEDLLELAKLQTSRFSLEIVNFPIIPVLEELASSTEIRCVEDGHLFRFLKGEATDLVLRSDPNRMIQVLRNLLDNASKFASTAVQLEISKAAEGLRITVTDDGPGLTDEDKEKLFKEQYRSPRLASITKGSGLGLLIVGQLARALSVGVDYRSPVIKGRGTQMRISIPNDLIVTSPWESDRTLNR